MNDKGGRNGEKAPVAQKQRNRSWPCEWRQARPLDCVERSGPCFNPLPCSFFALTSLLTLCSCLSSPDTPRPGLKPQHLTSRHPSLPPHGPGRARCLLTHVSRSLGTLRTAANASTPHPKPSFCLYSSVMPPTSNFLSPPPSSEHPNPHKLRSGWWGGVGNVSEKEGFGWGGSS